MLKFDVYPMTTDRFMAKHLLSINYNVKLFKSSQFKYDISFKINADDEDIDNKQTECATNKFKSIIYEEENLKVADEIEIFELNKEKKEIELYGKSTKFLYIRATWGRASQGGVKMFKKSRNMKMLFLIIYFLWCIE